MIAAGPGGPPVRCHPSKPSQKGEYVAVSARTRACRGSGSSAASTGSGSRLPSRVRAPPVRRPRARRRRAPSRRAPARVASRRRRFASVSVEAAELLGHGRRRRGPRRRSTRRDPPRAGKCRRGASRSVCLAASSVSVQVGPAGVADAADSPRSDRIRRRKGPAAGSAAMRSTTGWTADWMSERPAAVGSTNSSAPPHRLAAASASSCLAASSATGRAVLAASRRAVRCSADSRSKSDGLVKTTSGRGRG